MDRALPFTARDGRRGIVRAARPRDARASLAIVRATSRELPRTILVLESELWSPREWRRHRMSWGSAGVTLAAEIEGVLVGTLSCVRETRASVRHVAEFGLTVATAARGVGVGRALIEALERWAREMGVSRLELSVFQGNERARGLYSALGYLDEGLEKRKVRFPEGEIDVIRMAKLLG